MKTIEEKYKEALDKAKRYDEVFNAAKEWYNNPNSSSIGKSYLYAVFPELKESEDEMIRKWLEEHIEAMPDNSLEFKDVKRIDVLHWLEKQKEFVSADFDDVWETADCDELIAPLEKYSKDAIKKMCHAWYDKGIELERRNWLEKQGEQKPQGKTALEAINEEKVDNSNRVEPKDYNSIDPHFGKSIDKIEPKFHEGDWIVHHGTENIYQVVAVIDNQYQLKYGDNYTVQNCADVDRCARLWDITKDAKEGDVLVASDESLFIFARAKDNAAYHHFSLCKNGSQEISDGKYAWEVAESCHPATKEQRDKLEKAMADAGYTFDFEKKELKKIEDEIEIPFGSKDSELQEATYYIPKGFHAEIDGDKVVIKKGEKPTAWSEEDEGILDEIIDFFENGTVKLQHDLSLYASWLKSLKGRVGCEANCTTTKEWSEEDEKKLNLIIARLQSHPDVDLEEYSKEYDWLNSPKYRYTWKPSDAQMNTLEHYMTTLVCNEHKEILFGLYEDLKKLK